MIIQTSGFSASAEEVSPSAEEIPTLQSSGFEAENSFLTYDQYQGLGFDLPSASSSDKKPDLEALEGASLSGFSYKGVKYGWSNPQVIAVMLSTPYWNELDYGSEMTSPGYTSFSLSSGVEGTTTGKIDLELGISISASAKTDVFGSSVEVGGELQAALNAGLEIQKSKAGSTTLNFNAGAGEDHVALVVFPVACYEYTYTSGGKTESVFINVQLEPKASTTSLSNYNRVAREYNLEQTEKACMLPVIDMQDIRPNYLAGDPTTAFSSKSDLPDCLLFENGRLIASEADSSHANSQITGEVYVSSTAYSVSPGNADTGADSSLELSSSSGQSLSLGVTLGASVYVEVTEGADLVVAEVSASQRLTVSGSLGASVSHARLNTNSVSYTIQFIDLPASANTGSTGQGIATSDYSFTGRLFVWFPKDCGSDIPTIAPTIIGALVEFPASGSLPLYLPDDLHATAIAPDSVTLSWTNPDFSESPFMERKPAVYEIVTIAKGSAGDVYTTIGTTDGGSESYTITGMSPETEYTYLLRASDGNGRYSTYGPPISVTTSGTDCPSIEIQPKDITVPVGGSPLFTIEAKPTSDSYALRYQWYKLEKARYGSSWKAIPGATGTSFNPAYYEADGKINAANRYDLNGTIYRCAVTEVRGSTAVSMASNAVVLKIADIYYIRTYEDLRQIATSIQLGHKEAAGYYYILANDITCPSGENWDVPIGSSSVPFTGTFDGRGHTISGLSGDVTSVSNFGLFGVLSDATVKDLHLENVDIAADYAYVGAICGKAQNSVISNCTVSGTVALSAGEGGYAVGGLCGHAGSGTVIEKCINHSALWMQADSAGGVCGLNYGTVINCANFGSLEIYCPYFDHMPTSAYGGGIAGTNNGSVKNCYNAGTLTSKNATYGETTPLCHRNGAVNSYYVNRIDNAGGGRITAKFNSGEVAYLLNGGVTDGTQVWYQNIDNGLTPDAYPTLSNNGQNTVYKVDKTDKTYSNDDGFFEIGTPEELMEFAELVNTVDKGLNGILIADIDMSGITDFTPIGQTGLYYNADPAADGNWGHQGIFNGNGHVIRNLTITGSPDEDLSFGIFGTLSGTVYDLGVENFTYIGAGMDSRVGAVAGQILAGGTITDCYLSGASIDTQVGTTNGVAGGIAGANYAGTVQNCYVHDLTVKAGRAGGIVGDNYGDASGADGSDRPGTVTNCYTSTGGICNRGTGTGYVNVSDKVYASGEIAWLLGGDWKQGTNGLPSFTGDTVYQNTCEGDIFYATTDGDFDQHSFRGVRCTNCNCYDAPELVTADNYSSLGLDESYIGFYAFTNGSNFYWFSERDSMRNITGGIVLLGNVILSNTSEPWTPINVDGSFTFDGRGNTLKLTLDFGQDQRSDYLGLFSVFNYAAVKALRLFGSVTGCTTSHMGGFSASVYRSTVSGLISYVDVTNICESGGSAGGIAGYFGGQHSGGLRSLIENSAVYADISGYNAGGLVGYGWGGWQYYDIKGATYVGNVTGYGHGGAIIGYHNNNQTATACTFIDIYYCETDGLGFSGGGNTNYTLGSDVAPKTRRQFASGEVAYLLNSGVTDGSQVWYQNLDNGQLPNLYPQLTASGNNTVYPIMDAAETSIRGYSNHPFDSKQSILQRVDLRVYHRVIEEDGGISPNSATYLGYGLVDNANKTITIYTTDTVGTIGLLMHQGEGGVAGEMRLLGYGDPNPLTSAEILASGQKEDDIYTDRAGCIFIKIPDDPTTLPELKVSYTSKETKDYTATEYTLIIKIVSKQMLQTIGATSIVHPSPEDPDYDVIVSTPTTEPIPGTGDLSLMPLCILLTAAVLSLVMRSTKKKNGTYRP